MARIIMGFTGTQEGMNLEQKVRFCNFLFAVGSENPMEQIEFHHGDCVGSDEQADYMVRELYPDWSIHIHPPLNKSKEAYCARRGSSTIYWAKHYLIRNRDIAKTCNILIAAPKEEHEVRRSGTWSTIRYARGYGKEIHIMFPNGEVKVEQSKEKQEEGGKEDE